MIEKQQQPTKQMNVWMKEWIKDREKKAEIDHIALDIGNLEYWKQKLLHVHCAVVAVAIAL